MSAVGWPVIGRHEKSSNEKSPTAFKSKSDLKFRTIPTNLTTLSGAMFAMPYIAADCQAHCEPFC